MAVRVRKLAKQMNRTPAYVIGVLHAIGFDRYKSSEDMLQDHVVARLERAVADKVAPLDVPVDGPKQKAESNVKASGPGLMDKLVPGVVPHGAVAARVVHEPAPAARVDEPVAVAAAPAHTKSASVEASRAELEAERARLEVERIRWAKERARFQAELAELEAVKAEVSAAEARLRHVTLDLEAARKELVAERDAERAPIDASQAPRLLELMEGRGLRGVDEAERAIAALAAARSLRGLLDTLHVADPERLARSLARDLLLVGGRAPEGLPAGVAVVAVAPERADLPDASELSAKLQRLGERLLLSGMRRVAVVGGHPRWQKLLREGLDQRIELRFRPGPVGGAKRAESDVLRTDLIALWGTAKDEAAGAVYADSKALVVHVVEESLSALVQRVGASLD